MTISVVSHTATAMKLFLVLLLVTLSEWRSHRLLCRIHSIAVGLDQATGYASQDELGGLQQERTFGVKMGVGHRYFGWGGIHTQTVSASVTPHHKNQNDGEYNIDGYHPVGAP